MKDKVHGAPPLDLSDPALLAAVLATADDAIVITEAEPDEGSPYPRIVFANEGYTRMTGFSREEVLGQTPRIAQGPGTDRATLDRIRKKLKAWQPIREELLNYRKDGTPFWVELNIRPLADETGWFTHWVSVQRDVTARHEAMAALAQHARDLEDSQKLAKLGIWRWTVGTDVLQWSSEVFGMFGLDEAGSGISFQRALAIVCDADKAGVLAALERSATLGTTVTFEFQTMRNGMPFRTVWAQGHAERNEGGRIVAVRGLCQDVTERRAAERSLSWSASHDGLTGLLNMEGFRARASSLIAMTEASGRNVVVGLVDLDQLKLVNDTLGHPVGDALIVEAARRLKEAFGEDSCIGRLGGDEFVFVKADRRTADQLAARLRQLVELLKRPFDHHGSYLDCGASIGVTVSKPQDADLDTLLRNADLAMYRAKEIGRGTFAFFSAELQEGVDQRVAHLNLARLAVGSKLVVPHYQPKVSLSSGLVVGYEALMRVQMGSKIMPPSAVEHAFEHVELAMRLGDEMLRRVLEQIRAWRRQGIAFGSVAVNVSAAELIRPDYADRVIEALQRANVPPSCLEIEVTEGVVVGRGADRVADTLRRLRSTGIRVDLDDFGTGYASLTHLKSLPITGIKIDRSFVQEIASSSSDAAIVRSVIGLADALRLDVVAEGVETAEQAEVLKLCGCEVAQGYLYGRAASAHDLFEEQAAIAVRR